MSRTQRAYISYAWGGESERIANEVDADLRARGIDIVRDKRDLGYRGSIKRFMEDIGRSAAVVVIVSDEYLRSKHCMFELTALADNDDLRDRIFPIVLADADIYDSVNVAKYLRHWEDEQAKLEAAIDSLRSSANTRSLREDLDSYSRYRVKISELVGMFGDMNTLTPAMHEGSDFSALAEALEERLAHTATTSPPSTETSDAPASPAVAQMSSYVNAIMQSVVRAGVDNFTVFGIRKTERYMQVAAFGDGLRAEVSSNRFLEGSDRWSDGMLEQLASLGWSEPVDDDQPNHSIEFTGMTGDDEGLLIELFSRRMGTTLVEVFGVASPGRIQLTMGDLDGDTEDGDTEDGDEIEDGVAIDLSRMTENQQYLLRDALPHGVARSFDGDALVVDATYDSLVALAFNDQRFATLQIGDETPHDPYEAGGYYEFPDSSTDDQVELSTLLLEAEVRFYWVTDTGVLVHPDDEPEAARVVDSLYDDADVE